MRIRLLTFSEQVYAVAAVAVGAAAAAAADVSPGQVGHPGAPLAGAVAAAPVGTSRVKSHESRPLNCWGHFDETLKK